MKENEKSLREEGKDPDIREIKYDELKKYKDFILPAVYDELKAAENKRLDTGYICLAAYIDDTIASVMISDTEDNGDLNLLSIYTKKEFRRRHIGTLLFLKTTYIARQLFTWDDKEYGDDILFKTMYSLRESYRDVFEAYLKANDFTDFYILKDGDEKSKAVVSASAEVHFFRYGED